MSPFSDVPRGMRDIIRGVCHRFTWFSSLAVRPCDFGRPKRHLSAHSPPSRIDRDIRADDGRDALIEDIDLEFGALG